MANVPTFVIVPEELDGVKMDPCTTDILIELFDFGSYTEKDLDLATHGMQVGDTRKITCSIDYEETIWYITLRRIS